MRFVMRPVSFCHYNVPSIIAVVAEIPGISARSVTASRGNNPKFSASNLVNVITCQAYPPALEDLIATKECLITKCH